MRRTPRLILWLAIPFVLAVVPFAWAAVPQPESQAPASPTGGRESLFIENVGQFAPAARFLALNGTGYTWLTKDGIWFSMYGEAAPAAGRHASGRRSSSPALVHGAVLRMSFAGANPSSTLVPVGPAQVQISYLLGNDPDAWRTAVPVWHEVRYEELYPGIDLVVGASHGEPWRLETRAGADLAVVRLRVEGAETARLESGGLRLTTAAGDFSLPLLRVEGTAGHRTPLPAAIVSMVPQGAGVDGGAKFEVAAPFAQDVARASLAEPAAATDLLLSTYLGGGSWEQGRAIAVNGDGAIYVTGETPSTNFPLTPGAFDSTMAQTEAFVTKLNAAGTALVYSTFLGGSSQDGGWSIAVDNSGQAWVSGETASSDFPLSASAYDASCGSDGTCNAGGQGPYSDAFVAQLNATGTGLVYATYLGGADEDYGYDIALDSGNALVTGTTWSNDFAAGYNGSGDAFVARFSSGGTLAYKVLLGGGDTDGGFSIASAGGNAYVAGETYSPDFATGYKGGGDGFVAKLTGAGQVAYRTLLGGGAWDRSSGVAVDNLSQAYVTGLTQSSNFPATTGSYGGHQDAFVAKLNSSGSIAYAAYLGGSGSDEGLAVALDSYGGFTAAGLTGSSDFPTAGAPYAAALAGSFDAFVTRFDLASLAPNQRTYSTYLGGARYDEALDTVLDAAGRAYLTGDTQSSDFPTTAGAYDTAFDGSKDAFVAVIAVAKGNLQVTKTVDWNGVTPDPGQAFEICITGPSFPTGSCRSVGQTGGVLTWSNLIPGNYVVSETSQPEWTVDITGSPAVVPPEGGAATAQITNTRVPVKPPQPPAVTILAQGANAVLTWSPVANDVDGNPVDVIEYRVWRSTEPYFTPSGAYYTVTKLNTPSFTDEGVVIAVGNGYYIVQAVSDDGLSSDNSNQVAEFTFELIGGG